MTVFYRKKRRKWGFEFQFNGTRYFTHPTLGSGFDTHREAKAAEEEVRHLARKAPKAVIAPTNLTVLEALENFSRSVMDTANLGNVIDHISEFLSRPEFSPTKDLRDVTEQDIRDYVSWAKQQVLQVWIGGPDRKRVENRPREELYRPHPEGKRRSNSTITHYLATLRAAMNMAHKTFDPATQQPLLPRVPEFPSLSIPKRKPRPINEADITRIIREGCRVSAQSTKIYRKHLVHAVLLCRLMGFRKAEVFGLVSSNVDFEAGGYWLSAENTKGNRDELVRANPQAQRLLAFLCRQAAAHNQDRLILYRDHATGEFRPVKDADRAWNTMRVELGIEHHVFHNTKASYVTQLSRKASQRTAQEGARHKHYKTTLRYIEVTDEDLQTATNSIPFKAVSPDKKSRQSEKGGPQPKLRVIK